MSDKDAALANELDHLVKIAMLAKRVVSERRAKINHARETTTMCRLAKALDEWMTHPPREGEE